MISEGASPLNSLVILHRPFKFAGRGTAGTGGAANPGAVKTEAVKIIEKAITNIAPPSRGSGS